MAESYWARRSPAGRVALGFGMAWGPGIVIGLVLYLVTSHWYFGILGFAVVCALTSVVLGSIGATLRKRREPGAGGD
ncbi:hypothetical protein [uncultured Jatrophihabitans sp.]|uniref:hypothetical protein n=1 Tax=uncultured Jatrophihabitans sp. TaxID=1610747 RepID=UPI0035C9A6EC